MKGKTFKDLECWKKARELVKGIYQISQTGTFSKDFGLRDQIQRSAVSVMANIAEGFGTFSDVEFVRFLSISIRSAYEVQSHLCVALDAGYLEDQEVRQLDRVCDECVNLSKGFIRYLKEKN